MTEATNTPRTPTAIAAEYQATIDAANTTFVPAPVVRLGELSGEFMTSAAAVIEDLSAKLAAHEVELAAWRAAA